MAHKKSVGYEEGDENFKILFALLEPLLEPGEGAAFKVKEIEL